MYHLHLSSMHHPVCDLALRPFYRHLVRVITVPLELRVACPILSYLVRFHRRSILARRYTISKKQIQSYSRMLVFYDRFARRITRLARHTHFGIVEADARRFLALASAKYNMHYSANVPRSTLEQSSFQSRDLSFDRSRNFLKQSILPLPIFARQVYL